METSAASHSPVKSAAVSSNGGAQPPAMHNSSSAHGGGSQLRSRITVVCAECKRLKLKCDRRTPCGSCTKRDCIEKCVYSPAAAEKIDVQSLHNRLLATEAQLSQVLSGRIPIPHSISSSSSLPSYNDRALLAVGVSGSSVVISLEDVAGLWLEELDISADGLTHHSSPSASDVQQEQSSVSSPSQPHPRVKLEPAPPTLPSLPPFSTPSSISSILLSLPPYQSYFRQPSTTSPDALPAPDLPTVTPAIFAHLPAHPRLREALLGKCEHMHRLHPSFNWFHFKRRVRALFDTNISTGIDRAAAHEILFGKGPGSPARKAEAPRHTLSFFAAVAAALALGALAWKEEGYEGLEAMREDGDAEPQVGKDGKRPRKAKAGKASSGPASEGGREALQHPDPAALYALSRQALDIFEMFHPHDLDFLVAMDMQVLFLLHDGIPNISSVVFPMVGKMVNVARAMGLAMDPDEFPSRYSLFEAETRRRIWWDVFYYDLFVSDCMGHPPLIADNSHTTKIPVSDVDEERFVPESIEIPTCKEEDSSESAVNSSTYLVLKCRLAQLVKSVKKRSFRDPLADASRPTMALEQVAGFEAEVAAWLRTMPAPYHMSADVESCVDSTVSSPLSPGSVSTSPADSPYLVAQRCELSIVAHRLLLKIYVPFLRNRVHGDTTARSPHWHQASFGAVNAAHNIVQACRALHTVWQQNKRPAAFVFYSFGRTLFDAAVCVAHALIQQPTAMWAKTAMEDAKQVLEILKDPKVATGRGPVNGGVEGSVSEAVTIVEKMLKKAQQAVKANTPGSGVHAGVKRKHEEVDIDHTLAPGFHLPYVGAGVQVANAVSPPEPVVASSPVVAHPRPSSSRSSRRGSTAIPPAVLNSKTSTPDPDGENRKSGKSSKSGRPNVGIRVRGGKEGPPFNKARHDHGSSSPASARPYSPASHRVTAFELTPFPESGFTAESPIYLDAPEDKDFNMTFAGNTEPRTEAMEKGPSNAQTRSREPSGADNYDVQPSPAFNPMSGSYNTFAVSPAYSNEASNRPPSSRSDQPPPFSSGYPQNAGSPYPPPGSSHGAPQQSSPPSYSPAGPTGGYNALTPHNPFPPTPETIYTSNAGSASYSHDVLHSHHMRIMNGGVDPRAMSMAPDMSAAMPQSNHGQRNMRPPSLPSDHRMGTIPVQPYSIQSAKPMHPGPQHYMDAPTPGHVASQSQSMMGTEAWTSEEGMQTATQYWNQGQNYHEMKLDNYS